MTQLIEKQLSTTKSSEGLCYLFKVPRSLDLAQVTRPTVQGNFTPHYEAEVERRHPTECNLGGDICLGSFTTSAVWFIWIMGMMSV